MGRGKGFAWMSPSCSAKLQDREAPLLEPVLLSGIAHGAYGKPPAVPQGMSARRREAPNPPPCTRRRACARSSGEQMSRGRRSWSDRRPAPRRTGLGALCRTSFWLWRTCHAAPPAGGCPHSRIQRHHRRTCRFWSAQHCFRSGALATGVCADVVRLCRKCTCDCVRAAGTFRAASH